MLGRFSYTAYTVHVKRILVYGMYNTPGSGEFYIYH